LSTHYHCVQLVVFCSLGNPVRLRVLMCEQAGQLIIGFLVRGEEKLLSGGRARFLLVDVVAAVDAFLLAAGVRLSECGSWQA